MSGWDLFWFAVIVALIGALAGWLISKMDRRS